MSHDDRALTLLSAPSAQTRSGDFKDDSVYARRAACWTGSNLLLMLLSRRELLTMQNPREINKRSRRARTQCSRGPSDAEVGAASSAGSSMSRFCATVNLATHTNYLGHTSCAFTTGPTATSNKRKELRPQQHQKKVLRKIRIQW